MYQICVRSSLYVYFLSLLQLSLYLDIHTQTRWPKCTYLPVSHNDILRYFCVALCHCIYIMGFSPSSGVTTLTTDCKVPSLGLGGVLRCISVLVIPVSVVCSKGIKMPLKTLNKIVCIIIMSNLCTAQNNWHFLGVPLSTPCRHTYSVHTHLIPYQHMAVASIRVIELMLSDCVSPPLSSSILYVTCNFVILCSYPPHVFHNLFSIPIIFLLKALPSSSPFNLISLSAQLSAVSWPFALPHHCVGDGSTTRWQRRWACV